MLSMKDTGLVEGVPLEPNKRPVLVRALGGFYDEDRKEVKTGDVTYCTEAFARYLFSINRAERVTPIDVTPEPVQQVNARPAEPEPENEPEPQPEPEPETEDEPTRRRGRRRIKDD